jgi:HEAT repeat protein
MKTVVTMKRYLVILTLIITINFLAFSLSYAELSTNVEIPEDLPDAVKERIAYLHSSDRIERRNAALELWEMGTPAAHAVPYLISLLSNEDWYVRKDAIFALGIICDIRAEEALKKLEAEDPVPAIRKAAAVALKSIKSKGKGGCER